MRIHRLAAAAVLVPTLVLAGAACSSDPDDDAPDSSSATATTTVTADDDTNDDTNDAADDDTNGNDDGDQRPASDGAVLRGAKTGDNEVDVLVRVGYRDGKVSPDLGTVRVKPGDEVEVHVSSDTSDDIVVSGHPDGDGDVDATEPEDIDFRATSGTTKVSLRKAGVTLVSFRA